MLSLCWDMWLACLITCIAKSKPQSINSVYFALKLTVLRGDEEIRTLTIEIGPLLRKRNKFDSCGCYGPVFTI